MKKIVKNFNKFIEKTIFKAENKTINNLKISSFNKHSIVLICLLFFYLFYLLVPLLYAKNWVQANIETKLLKEFNINISTSSDISYRILPAPHFLIKDSKIFIDKNEKLKSIADIKNLKVFLRQGNFFDKKKMNIKKIIINKANFSLLISDLKILNKNSNNKFSNKKIKINNSNIFFKNSSDETLAITKIKEATLFFDEEKFVNLFNLKGEVYAIPFTFNFKNQNNPKKDKEMNFRARSLNLNIFNKSNKEKNNYITGNNTFSILDSMIYTRYDIKNNVIFFKSNNSKIKNSKFNYNGKLSIKPFDLDLSIDLVNKEIFNILNSNSILAEFIKSKLLFNDNINVSTSILFNSKKKFLHKAKINFHIINGKINLNNSKLFNDKIGLLELKNSNLFLENNSLVLNTDLKIDIKNINNLFSFLNISKKARKNVKNILINIDYNFLSNQIKFNNIKVDNNKVSDEFLILIEEFSDNNNNNLTKSRRLLNELFTIYKG